MKKKEDPVSKKIKMLRDEGKPQDQAVAIALDMERRGKLKEIIREEVMSILEEKKGSNHPSHYSAPEGSKRDKQLDATKADLASGDPKRVARAYRRRDRMEKAERKKKGFKNVPRSDTKKESVRMPEATLREMIRKTLEEELSKATKASLKKKAEKRGLTPSSVYAEFRKGLAAWASSGSRKGMSQHQWAHARVNAATPSKPWAVVKKAKKKKHDLNGPYILWIDGDKPVRVTCDMRFINHSDQPNAAYYDDLSVLALRDIEPGEEIVHNYMGDAADDDAVQVDFDDQVLDDEVVDEAHELVGA